MPAKTASIRPGRPKLYATELDTGSGPQPYFAMELIRGQPLDAYASARQLDTRQRLELMAKISRGAGGLMSWAAA